MAGERKGVTIHYRKFVRNASVEPRALEQMIRDAMAFQDNGAPLRSRYMARMHSVGTDNYFINTYADTGPAQADLAFGDIIHFTRGHLQALCQTADQGAASVPVQQMRAPERSASTRRCFGWLGAITRS